MKAPQLEFYAAARGNHTAIIHTDSGRITAWVQRRDDDTLVARTKTWVSEPAETIPQLMPLVAAHWAAMTQQAAQGSSR